MNTRLGLPHQEEREYIKYNRPSKWLRALRGGASVIGGTGRRSATSEKPENTKELGLREEISLDKREFNLILR